MNIKDLEDEIYKIDGFTVSVIGDDDIFLKEYYKREYNRDGKKTVSDWKDRFKKRYPGFLITAHKGNGEIAHGNMLVGNLRSSYDIEQLRHEIGRIKLELEYASPKNNQVPDPYKILDIDKTRDLSEVKAAYRRMCQQFHPDKVNPSGLHHDFMEFAKQRMQEINSAYDEIKNDLCDEVND